LGGTGYTLTEIYDALVAKIALIDPAKILTGETYFGKSGTMANNGAFALTAGAADQAVTAGYYSGGTLAGDTDLISNNIKSGVNIFGIDGDSNVVDTSSGDAVAGDILVGKIAWVDGAEITGTIETQTLSADSATVSAGYYEATTLSAVDSDLTAANILSGTTIFGVAGSASSGYTYGDDDASYVLGTATGAGTALKNLWNGTNTPSTFPGGSQALGGVDDYNANNAAGRPADSYPTSTVWTQCNSGNNWCGTDIDDDENDNEAGADAKDNSTGLIWSLPCNGDGCASFSNSAPGAYSWDNSATPGSPSGATGNNSKTASELCSNQTGWSLPHQKQLMQAYIDGSWDKNLGTGLEGVNRSYWSATTSSATTTLAWYTFLSFGTTYTNSKTSAYYVRCVRPAI